MQCNIDARGRAVRLVAGIIVLLLGVGVLFHACRHDRASAWSWTSGTLLLVIGGFQIYEGWAGWCVVRAMGFKTRF